MNEKLEGTNVVKQTLLKYYYYIEVIVLSSMVLSSFALTNGIIDAFFATMIMFVISSLVISFVSIKFNRFYSFVIVLIGVIISPFYMYFNDYTGYTTGPLFFISFIGIYFLATIVYYYIAYPELKDFYVDDC